MATVLRVPLTDDSLVRLQARADASRRDLEHCAQIVLQAGLMMLPPSGRCVVVSGEALEVLERILGSGSVLNGPDLCQKVERLAGISYGHLRLAFTPGQLEEIATRAERLGLSAEELVRRTVQKMEELFFTYLGVGAQG